MFVEGNWETTPSHQTNSPPIRELIVILCLPRLLEAKVGFLLGAKPNKTGTWEPVPRFDPLDGSSNVDAGIAVGTIFGIFKEPAMSALVSARRKEKQDHTDTLHWGSISRETPIWVCLF